MGWLLPRKRHICTPPSPHMPTVILVCSGCCMIRPPGREVRVCYSAGGWESPIKAPQMWRLVKVLFPASPAVSSWGAVRASPWVSTLMTSAKPNDLLKAPPPNTVALEIRVRQTNFWGSINIQFLTVHPPGPPTLKLCHFYLQNTSILPSVAPKS